jgi:phosphomannomutase
VAELKISVSGIRGVVGASIDPRVVLRFSSCFGRLLGGGAVVVGRDTRPSGEALLAAAVSGLLGTGCDVVDIGIVPTPTVLHAARARGAAGGVVVTASHNPVEWNALKLVGPGALFLHGDLGDRLRRAYRENQVAWSDWKGCGLHSREDGIGPHLEAILGLPVVDTGAIRKRSFTVVLDAVNGAGGEAASLLLRELGCRVIELNCAPTGRFGRGPEPVPENLGELERVVAEAGADAGFALDPDGDRLSLVSEKGKAVGEEMTVPIAADLVLRHETGPVVVNLSTSMTVEDVARARGVPVHRTPVGEVNVALEMLASGAVIGGEGNGGVMYPALHPCRDGLCGIALVLESLVETEKSLGALAASLPRYYIEKRKTPVAGGGDRVRQALTRLAADAPGELNTDDGLRIAGDGWWVHLRPSNTEPVVRIIAEARAAGEAARLARRYEEKIVELLRRTC